MIMTGIMAIGIMSATDGATTDILTTVTAGGVEVHLKPAFKPES